jgi:hypothetical protein
MSGSVRVLGATTATELLGRLEALGREGRVEGAAALLALLEPELDRVRVAAAESIASVTPGVARAREKLRERLGGQEGRRPPRGRSARDR